MSVIISGELLYESDMVILLLHKDLIGGGLDVQFLSTKCIIVLMFS